MSKGRLWLRIACWGFVATAILHLVGHFQDLPRLPDENGLRLLELVESYEIEVAGVRRSTADLLDGFSLCFSAFCLFVGLAGLAVARQGGTRLVRTVAALQAILAAGLAVISALLLIPPPAVCFAAILACSLAALLGGRSASDANDSES